MEASNKDISRAKYRLSQSRKSRAHGARGAKTTSARPTGASHGVREQEWRDLSEDETGTTFQGEDFSKLLADATQYYGTNHGHRQAAMLDALLAPQQAPLISHIDTSQVRPLAPFPCTLGERRPHSSQ